MSLSPQTVLRSIAGWETATVTELSGGLTNTTWLVEQDGRKAVLKIDEGVRGEPYNSRSAEASIQSMAAGYGLANGVIHASERVLLTWYAEGDVWEPRCLEQDDNIERVAAALRLLHSLPLSGRSFDAVTAARRYASKIDNTDQELVRHCTALIEKMRLPHNLCCCHNDLVAENIIASPDVKFLDWEYACDNDPLFDLATIVEHHQLDEELACRLLEAYFDGDCDHWRAKLKEQQELYLALYWLWLASRPGSTQEECDAIGARIRR